MTNQTYNGTGKITLQNGKKIAYSASEDLKEAVNLALLINRPLLLMGEPGVGKTQLAKAIADEWYGDSAKSFFFQWNIKSTTKAQEGLYRYDALKRLSDAQIFKTEEERTQLNNVNIGKKDSYFQYGPLAEAIQKSTINDRAVLLIDEIDKADIDFPNDLLHELEDYEFTIPETGEEVKNLDGFLAPLIIITSNREKELPPAFLRRCIYFYIDFPKDEELQRILINHNFTNVTTEDIDVFVKAFLKIRGKVNSSLSGTDKKLSTSELVDWANVFDLIEKDNSLINKGLNMENLRNWIEDDKENGKIPFAQILLKNIETVKLFNQK